MLSPGKAIHIPIYDNRDEAATHLWPILMGGSLKHSAPVSEVEWIGDGCKYQTLAKHVLGQAPPCVVNDGGRVRSLGFLCVRG